MIQLYVVYNTLTLDPKAQKLKVKVQKQTSKAQSKQRRAVMAILTSDKIHFKSKKITETKKNIYMLM